MCGRFTLRSQKSRLAKLTGADLGALELAARYNVSPSQPVVVVRGERGGRAGRLLRWGLVPSWAKDAAIGYRLINARSETAHEKPAFRLAFRCRRCLIPTDGFYEWRKTSVGEHATWGGGGAVGSSGSKQPYLITRADGEPFCMAGLWEHWQDAVGNDLETCTILTTAANELIGELHDRMPVILDPNQFEFWLEPGNEEVTSLRQLCKPYPAELMMHRPVSTFVNSPKRDGPRCVEPVDSGCGRATDPNTDDTPLLF